MGCAESESSPLDASTLRRTSRPVTVRGTSWWQRAGPAARPRAVALGQVLVQQGLVMGVQACHCGPPAVRLQVPRLSRGMTRTVTAIVIQVQATG